MSHRITFTRSKSDRDLGHAYARKTLEKAYALVTDHSSQAGSDRWEAYTLSTTHTLVSRAAAEVARDRMNDTFDRIRYAMDNPDTALSFAEDGTPRLIATDDSGIDQEVLFKIGRVAR